MNITEIEKSVGLTKANIKYYQSEGLLAPGKNSETGKIDYTADDQAALKKIKILRTAGVPLEAIKTLMLSNKSMVDALNETEKALTDQMNILEEKRVLCMTIRNREEAFHNMDLSAYNLETQTPHVDPKAVCKSDKVFRSKFIDFLATLIGALAALVLLLVPAYFNLTESMTTFPWWGISICAALIIVSFVILFTSDYKKNTPKSHK